MRTFLVLSTYDVPVIAVGNLRWIRSQRSALSKGITLRLGFSQIRFRIAPWSQVLLQKQHATAKVPVDQVTR